MSMVYSYVDGQFHPTTLEFGNHSLGEEWTSLTGVIPAGGVPYLGQLVSRSLYADLWAYVQEKIPGKILSDSEWQALHTSQKGTVLAYSTGDGSTTFRMPAFTGYARGAATLDEVGTYVAEGLPGITGDTGHQLNRLREPTGAFYNGSSSRENTVTGQSHTTVQAVEFDASRSSSIYGNSTHVTPETGVALYGVYAVSTISPIGEANEAGMLDAITTLEANYAKLVKSYITETWQDGTSWYRKWSDGWIEQGGIVTQTGVNLAVTFNVAFSDSNATLLIGKDFGDTIEGNNASHSFAHGVGATYHSVSQTGFTVSNGSGPTRWYACGY